MEYRQGDPQLTPLTNSENGNGMVNPVSYIHQMSSASYDGGNFSGNYNGSSANFNGSRYAVQYGNTGCGVFKRGI